MTKPYPDIVKWVITTPFNINYERKLMYVQKKLVNCDQINI